MTPAKHFTPHDLVLFVWPTRTSVDPASRWQKTKQEAVAASWAMDKAKADRVRILLSIHDETIVGAWRVTGSESTLLMPAGKSRRVNRARFETHEDARLFHLIGQPSQVPHRRNPQTTIELRDLVGGEVLLRPPAEKSAHGVVRLGDFTLTVREDGTADLVYPARSPLTLRPEGPTRRA